MHASLLGERWHSRLLIIASAALAASIFAVANDTRSTGASKKADGVAANDGNDRARTPIRYDRDIRPLLSEKCFKCHGPDPKSREQGLRLDMAESAMAVRDGKAAVVPGNLKESEIWRRVTSDDPEVRMPPPKSQKTPMTAAERERVRIWIESGANYEPHWSFVAPRRPDVPEVQDKQWPRNEVDRFVLAKQEENGVVHSPEAAPEILFRRMMLDLTGLPPTVDELDRFLKDTDPKAYEKWIDRIFSEEPYKSRHAERMTAPWLDLARYADTCGIHMDAGRQIWPWRDWVLRAYRDNKPFDRFALEQLAGDLLPNATLDQKVASGFNRNHVTSDEGGAIAEEYLVEYAVDRVNTTGSVFLGMTFGCARCHDHKFEPVTQEDFYKLFAFFDSIEEPGLYSQVPDAKRALEPFIQVPSDAQAAEREKVNKQLETARKDLSAPAPAEDTLRAAFFKKVLGESGVSWTRPAMTRAESKGGAKFTILPDGSALASGANPDKDDHYFTLTTDAVGLSLLSVEALTDPSLPENRVGRAFNGNAVLSGVEVEAVSVADPTKKTNVTFEWAFADHEQLNGDFRAVNVLDTKDMNGWAVQGHERAGNRLLLLLAEKPFGYKGGTEIRVHLQYQSVYATHVLGRVRFAVSPMVDAARERMPVAKSDWYIAGPFPSNDRTAIYEQKFGPESETIIDVTKNFGAGNRYWTHAIDLRDGMAHMLSEGTNVSYVGRRVFSPSARKLQLSLGSDDGIRVYANGKEYFGKSVDRPVAPDQDKAEIELRRGFNTVILKIVNTGGQSGFYYNPIPAETELSGDLVGAFAPAPLDAAPAGDTSRGRAVDASFVEYNKRVALAWRMRFSPDFKEKTARLATVEAAVAKLESEIPLTMVMKELDKPRDTFVLTRGLYNMPDPKRKVSRGIPAALGALASDETPTRLTLAKWLIAPENPLFARVAVNRLWELIFNVGIVGTSENLGFQGEYPSHPELLDWLAVEYRERGFDTQAMLKLLLTSAAYRQSSQIRPGMAERDPENRLLTSFPRRRLCAEQIRDAALYISGLYVEKIGGPSVKPYQPPGLWEEVAMPQSNTRAYARDMGESLYRRSIYTYWKRACPPPSLMTLDAPTREFCTVRRSSTNTPLQSLVLWNDEQFVEAARATAQRILLDKMTVDGASEANGDAARIVKLFRACASRAPREAEASALLEMLTSFRGRFRAAPDDAKKFIKIGESTVDASLEPAEVAAWTMLANSIFILDATICKN
ncbi:MAG: PSD1 domain-containing protein [Planctomycetes bacterium]|nr:PSD1 domain-containing protein [Planctomycetota bacterium]